MSAMNMTESSFGLVARDMPKFSYELVNEVQDWLDRELTREEIDRLRDLCQK